MKSFTDTSSSIKMRLYSLQKRHIAALYLLFIVILFLSYIVGLFGPDTYKTATIKASTIDKSNQINMKTGPFKLITPPLSKFNQQFWLYAQVIIEKQKEEFSKKFTINAHVHNENDKENVNNGQNVLNSIEHEQYFNRTRLLHCQNEICDNFVVLHLDYIRVQKYLIELQFYDLDDSTIKIKDIIFTFKSYNSTFTQLELWFRFIFLALTFVVVILYTNSLNNFQYNDWSIEQRWVFILSRFLIFYNNPLFPLVVLVDSWIPHLIDTICQITFYSLILVFWLSVFHGFRQHDRHCFKFYFPKSILVAFIWILSLILVIWQNYRSLHDPTYDMINDEKSFIGFQISYYVFIGLYTLYLLFLIVRALGELKNTPYFDIRLKFALSLMLMVVLATLISSFTRLNSYSIKQNLSEHIIKTYGNTIEFCTILTLHNIYIFTLAFLYSPNKSSAFDADYPDNPTFSILNNESDEDVIYGSDMDESRKALNKSSEKTTTTTKTNK